MDQIRLVSTYKGVRVPSMLFDSTGTKKIAALASYIIEGIEQGRILVVDKLDSSIHFKLTKAIVALFNNELNRDAQLIFTVHDINLMDCKKMFRKEQIWFVHKDEEGVYVYSLADFTAQEGVRDTTDIMEKYQGVAADLAGAGCLLISSVTGIPVSTTHTKTVAIMGVGAARRVSSVNWSVVKEMVLTWVLTFPGCSLIGFAMAKLFMWLF